MYIIAHLRKSFPLQIGLFYLPSVVEFAILSYPILCPILSCPIPSYSILSYLVLSCPIPSYPVLSDHIMSYAILSYAILSYPAPSLRLVFDSLISSHIRDIVSLLRWTSLATFSISILPSVFLFLQSSSLDGTRLRNKVRKRN